MTYKPRAQFQEFHARDQRWGCIVAHRRAGKTVACVNELITRAMATSKINARYAYIGPFYRQVKAIAWDYLKQYAEPLLVSKNEVDLEVTLHNGAKIRLFGADNPDSLRGLYMDGVIMDEFADMRPSVWGSVIRPMLADRKGWAVFIGTPKGHNSFYDIWQMARNDPEWYALMLRASASGLLEADELADARKKMTEDEYEREFECSFEANIQGAIYGPWMKAADNEGRIGAVPYNPKLPVFTSWDLGYSDTTAIWFYQVLFNEIHLIDFYEKNMEGIDHYCDVLKSKLYTYGRHYVPQDAAHQLMAAGGRSIVQQAAALGVKLSVVAETTHANAHEAVRLTLPICWFDEKTINGIEALRSYQYEFDDDKKIYKKTPRHDWASHASRAFDIMARIWRTPKEPAQPSRPRFLHEATADEVFWPKDSHAVKNQRI